MLIAVTILTVISILIGVASLILNGFLYSRIKKQENPNSKELTGILKQLEVLNTNLKITNRIYKALCTIKYKDIDPTDEGNS